jgi:hypothetical protein
VLYPLGVIGLSVQRVTTASWRDCTGRESEKIEREPDCYDDDRRETEWRVCGGAGRLDRFREE